jgi:myo-inositol-1-phosphate synthase
VHTCDRFGIWFIGARGNVATTTLVGAYALGRGLCPPTGMVTALPEFAHQQWAPFDEVPFGGWDITGTTLQHQAQAIATAAGTLRPDILDGAAPWLDDCDREIRPGTTTGCGERIRQIAGTGHAVPSQLGRLIESLQNDLRSFRERHDIDTVVVINLASTEPPPPPQFVGEDLDQLRAAIRRNDAAGLPASVVYAYAAIDAGFPYINFTPSTGASGLALRQLAELRGVPHYGNDGKTGETLIKSVLAPLFAMRNLRVLTWQGYNLLGNQDGRVLDDPTNKASKVRSKDHLLPKILGYTPHTHVGIDYVPSLDDWKTAWDLIHFEGFLGTRMTLQFTWQGCDSVLAAPLVLDLARLTALAHTRGERGLLTHLASFFKSPMGCTDHDLTSQFTRLQQYLAQIATAAPAAPAANAPPIENTEEDPEPH